MRAKPLAAAIAASGAIALTTSACAPSDPVDVQPAAAQPGARVSVTSPRCESQHATATSAAFSSPIRLSTPQDSTAGVGTIGRDADNGTYTVTVVCGEQTFVGWVTVTRMPLGAADTGDGSSQASASDGLATGAALATVGAALGTVALRRRRAGART